MRFPQSTTLAIAAKEFAQWISSLQGRHCLNGIANHVRANGHSDSHVNAAKMARNGASKDANAAQTPQWEPQSVAIAVSGGVDSMALVTLLARHFRSQAWQEEEEQQGRTQDKDNDRWMVPTQLHALIVDHKLRHNSTEEAAFVAQQVQKLGVTPHVLTLDWTVPSVNTITSATSGEQVSSADHHQQISRPPDKTHLETKARLERYKAIAKKCHALHARDLFVGHHAGDQAETVLFRLSRASGVDGLAGIQNQAPFGVLNVIEALDLRVLRPLLSVPKDRLEATCMEAGTRWVEDPSNRSLDYQRNIIRHYQQDMDARIKQVRHSHLRPLSTTSLLAFRERMDNHRRAAWDQGNSSSSDIHPFAAMLSRTFVNFWTMKRLNNILSFYFFSSVRPWLKDIIFDSANGVCHVKLLFSNPKIDADTPLGEGKMQQGDVEWLQGSQSHVATRLLSFLVHWISCKDHAPRLEDMQVLLKQLRQPAEESQSLALGIMRPIPVEADCIASPTAYRRRNPRVSRRSSNKHNGTALVTDITSKAPINSYMLSSAPHRPINVAGVLFTPPRTTRGIPGHWTLSRQPMSNTERVESSVGVPSHNSDLLWDHRFFISIQLHHLTSEAMKGNTVRVRPLAASDVPILKRALEVYEGRENQKMSFESWMAAVPGDSRFTIPVVYTTANNNQKNQNGCTAASEILLSVPTLDIHLESPSQHTIKSRFKSNSPSDGQHAGVIRDRLLK
ncbi:hypothetical protein EDD11_010158 [Mortierella claussenii]|nr:hypothetical protein EDD11_010158 [Mortierella claussenii]